MAESKEVYSSQRYGAAPPKFKPTPSPVQEKFFKEQIKSLPAAARERLKWIYASTGFTQEFQELLMRELVRPHDQGAGQDGAGIQSGASNNGGPNYNEDQIRSRPIPETDPGRPNRISNADRSLTASGRTSGMHNQYVYSQGNVRAEGVGPKGISGNTAFDTNMPHGPSDYHISSNINTKSSTSNDNTLLRQESNGNYDINRVNIRAQSGQRNMPHNAHGEFNQQDGPPRQQNQQVSSGRQNNFNQLDSNYQQQHQQQHIASDNRQYTTYSSKQTQNNQIPRVHNQQNFIQNQQETISNQNQFISTSQRQRQQYVQNLHNGGQQKLIQNQEKYQPQYNQNLQNNQQQLARTPQSLQNHQPGPNLQDQVHTNTHNKPKQARTNHQYQHLQTSSNSQSMKEQASLSNPNSMNTAQQTYSGNLENQNHFQQHGNTQSLIIRQSNNFNIYSENNVNSGHHSHSQNTNRFNSVSQPANNIQRNLQSGHNLQARVEQGHNLHTGQKLINNLRPEQQTVNNFNTGQEPINDFNTGQQPVNNLHKGHQPANNLHTGSQAVNNLQSGLQPVNNLHTGQQPVNNLHTGNQVVNNLQSIAQPVSIANYNTDSTLSTQTQAARVSTTAKPPQVLTTPLPPSPIIDFLNTKIIIPPHINGNPAMRAAFIKVITGAMGRAQAERKQQESSPTTPTPFSITTNPVTTATQMPAPIPSIAPTTTTTVSTTTVTTTSSAHYNKSVELAPALYLTWSLPQAQIDSLRGSTLSAILKSINTSRSEQMPGNTFVEGFKSFLIDTLLADPLSYVSSFDDVLPRMYYERIDQGATILIKDILGGFVRFEHSDLANRVKRSLSAETNSETWNKADQKWSSTFKSSTKCTGKELCNSDFTKKPTRNLGILGIVQDQMRQYMNKQYNSKNKLPSFKTSLNLKNMKLIWGVFKTKRNNMQIIKEPRQQVTVNSLRDNEDFICTIFETQSQRNKCMINLRNHHIKRSHLQCRKILTIDEKSKCKRKVVQIFLRRSCLRKDKGQERNAASRAPIEATRVRGCDRQRHTLRRRAASGPGVRTVPVLRFTWLLPKNSFPAAPVKTMQYIMDKYKRKVGVLESTTVDSNKETPRENPSVQQGTEINDQIAYLNKLIEAANALSKLQGLSVDVLAGALHNLVSQQGNPIGMILKSHAREGSPWNIHDSVQASTPPMPAWVPFKHTPSLTTPRMGLAATMQTMMVNGRPSDHAPFSTSVNSALPSLPVQEVSSAPPPPIGDVENLMLTMSTKFKNVPPPVLRSHIAHLIQQFHSGASNGTAHRTLVDINTGTASAPLTRLAQSHTMKQENAQQSSPPLQMTTSITDQTTGQTSMLTHETIILPTMTEIIIAPQVPPPTANPVITKSSPDPIKTLQDIYKQQTLSEITSPPFRVSTYPLSTMSVVANKYLMNIHFKGLPQLDLTTLPPIQPFSQSTGDISKTLPTSASPTEIADFMRYLMSTLRYSGHILPETYPSHKPMSVFHDSSITSSSAVNYSDKANSSFSNQQESLTQKNHLHGPDINSKSNIDSPITLKLSPSMETLTPMLQLSDQLFRPNQHYLDDLRPNHHSLTDLRPNQHSFAAPVTVNSMSSLDAGLKKDRTSMPTPSSSSLNNHLSSNVVGYVNSALNNILMSQPVVMNFHVSDNHDNKAKHSPSAVSEAGGTHSFSQGDLSIMSPAVLSQSNTVNTYSLNHHITHISPSKISIAETYIKPILKSSPPNEVKTPDVYTQGETNNQAGNYINEMALASQYEVQSPIPKSICPLGQTMECKPTLPSARLMSFCLERCDPLSGVCSSALCSCECLNPDAQPLAPKGVDTPAIPATSSNNAPTLDTLQSDGFQISMVNPDLLTMTTTQTPSLTTSEDRLRKFLNLLEKVKGKKPETTTEETEPADK